MSSTQAKSLFNNPSNVSFPSAMPASAALHERATRVLPGGNTRHTVHFAPHPLYAVRAKGSRVWDADGVERIDFINNYSSLIHGHNHPAIVEAIRRQADQLISIAMPTEYEIRLAEIIAGRYPAAEQVRFLNSGSEATLYAMKAARAFTKRPVIARIEGAYHGASESAGVSASPSPALWGPVDHPASVPDSGSGPGIAVDILVLHMNDVESGRRLLRENAARLAGVIIDPLVKNLGYKAATLPFLKMLREETEACGAMLIFDEVYSLRLGFHGAHGVLGVKPDLIAMGKIIGGGLPIGAVGGRRSLMTAVFDPRGGGKLAHNGTFNANPLTMAAGIAALEHFDEPAFDRLSVLGQRLRDGLNEALRISGRRGQVTGAASMAALLLTDAKIENYRDMVGEMMRDATLMPRTEKMFRHFLNNGVVMASQGFFVLSTAITEAEVDHTVETALSGLRALDE
jgi:glutamate-1-semialdehyde 2,1-aminomutase